MLSVADFCTRTILPKEDLDALTRLSWRYGGDTYAADTQPETDAGSVPVTGAPGATLPAPALSSASVAFEALFAGSSSPNFATLNVYKRSAGAARVLLATLALTSGPYSPGVRYALALQGAASVAFGDQITAEVVKAGTGAVLPAFTLYMPYSPTFVDARLLVRRGQIYARLKKRYAVPFADPAPEIALGWQEALVTLDCYRRRGYSPGSAQDSEIKGRADEAEAQLKEAADSKDGLFDLPLLESDESVSGISVGGPLGYSETSPYVSADIQACNGSFEDSQRRGSGP